MEMQTTENQNTYTRDFLAIERTIMANERTFLAYCRTAFALIIAGLTFLEFIKTKTLMVVGMVFVPLGCCVFIFGIYRFMKKKKAIRTDKYLLGKR
jgi:putative membrane protein